MFFYKQHFYKQREPKIGKKLQLPKQHPEAELLLHENYLLSSSTSLSSKIIKRCAKIKRMSKKQVCLFEWSCMINGNENEAENEKVDHKDTV